MSADREQTHFGYESVPLADKQKRVDNVFRSVARRYDLMNDLMSGGLHRAWKDALVSAVHPPKGAREFHVLDIAGGTGDVAFRVAEIGGIGTRVTVCDINADMLGAGRERAAGRGLDGIGSGGDPSAGGTRAHIERTLALPIVFARFPPCKAGENTHSRAGERGELDAAIQTGISHGPDRWNSRASDA